MLHLGAASIHAERHDVLGGVLLNHLSGFEYILLQHHIVWLVYWLFHLFLAFCALLLGKYNVVLTLHWIIFSQITLRQTDLYTRRHILRCYLPLRVFDFALLILRRIHILIVLLVAK